MTISLHSDIANLYSAAFDDAALVRALRALEKHTHSSIIHFLAFDIHTRMPVAGLASGTPEQDSEFRKTWASMDVRIERGMAQPLDQTWHQADLYRDNERESCPVYNEWLKTNDAQSGLGVMTRVSNNLILCSAAFRPERQGRYTDCEAALWSNIHLHLLGIGRLRHQYLDQISHTGKPDAFTLHLDAAGTVLHASAGTRNLIARNDGMSLRAGHLTLGTPARTQAFHRRLRAVLDGKPAPPVPVVTADGRPDLVLHICPASAVPFETFGKKPARVLVLIQKLQAMAPPEPQIVADVFGLTLTEAEVACAIASGATATDIARARGRALSTIRWTIRNVLDKMDLHRQSDLRALVSAASPNH
ncbi:hypothetical protein [uncultured Roseobacter sp.]|uniref:helix-turn-helix transcriptional regulator n=1 Tax=uncultured Roseobacter sp. TaxID=114847 RepID=UPI0026263A6F|nr:hypothetical protein [uncultured Roseobacter sp.]